MSTHLLLLHPQQHLLCAERLVVNVVPRLQYTQQLARPEGDRILLLCRLLLLLLLPIPLLLLRVCCLVNIHGCFTLTLLLLHIATIRCCSSCLAILLHGVSTSCIWALAIRCCCWVLFILLCCFGV